MPSIAGRSRASQQKRATHVQLGSKPVVRWYFAVLLAWLFCLPRSLDCPFAFRFYLLQPFYERVIGDQRLSDHALVHVDFSDANTFEQLYPDLVHAVTVGKVVNAWIEGRNQRKQLGTEFEVFFWVVLSDFLQHVSAVSL